MADMAEEGCSSTMPLELIPKQVVVWKYFGFKRADVAQTTVICKTCLQPVTCKGGNTSNLFSHLKNKHIVQYNQCQKIREETSVAVTSNASKQSKLVQHGIAEALASYTPYDKKKQMLERHYGCSHFLCG